VPPVAPHVSEEAVLVAESADPGAADGAGSDLRVAEPWPGYDRMKADEVIDRVGAASAEELAVIELYERQERDRRTVVAAVERRLRELAPLAARGR
jgi:hypothetical protein